MNKQKGRLGMPLEEYLEELYAKDPGMEAAVEAEVEALQVQAMLHGARKAAGLTQQQVADRMQVNRSFVSRLENHPQDMKLSTFQRYAHAVGRHMRLEVA